MDARLLSESFKTAALANGFDLCGIARLGPEPDYPRFARWLDCGHHAGMSYLERHQELRRDPRELLPGARSAVVVGQSYACAEADGAALGISRYARGLDYHPVVKAGLTQTAHQVMERTGQSFAFRICVDSTPILERSLARRAGLGWIGRNTCLIDARFGSYFFLGELLVDRELVPDEPAPERCGDCRRCLSACPTGALGEDGTLDAGRCLSYLTIENRGLIPREYHRLLGDMHYGCDRCQTVCPWNAAAPAPDRSAYRARDFPCLEELFSMSGRGFARRLHKSAVARARREGFLRNLMIHAAVTGRRTELTAAREAVRNAPWVVSATLDQLQSE